MGRPLRAPEISIREEPPRELSRGGQVAVVAGVLFGTFLAALDTSIVGTAMPTIVGQLGGLPLYPWVFSGYLLTSTTTVPLYGRLADLYGRKRLFVIATLLFLLGSILCGLAQSMPQLVLFRMLQGLGAGGIIPVTLTILGDLFSIEQRARLQGLTSAVWGTSAVIGPTVGGFITDTLSWRWVFYVNIPFGMASLLLIGLALSERVARRPHRIDYAGAAALTAGLTLLLLGLLRAGEGRGWTVLDVSGSLALGALLFGAFLLVEARAAEPVLPLRLFQRRLISVVFAGGVLIGVGMFGVTSYLPLFVQGVLGGTAITAGAVVMPFALGWSLASTASGRIILRFGFRTSVVAGMTAMLVAGLILQLVPGRAELLWPVAAAALFGVGMGFSSTAFIIAVQNAVGWEERGIVTALVGFSRTIGGAVGVAALGTVLSATMRSRLGVAASEASSNALLDPELRAALDAAQLVTLRAALADALGAVYLGILIAVALAFALVVFGFPRRPIPTQSPQVTPPGPRGE